jgi:Alpha/beta hydrolase family
MGLHRPVLVGHSLGAPVAVADARWYPDDPKAIVLLDGDAISAGGAPSWLSELLVGPWSTSLYRTATGADWIFRRGLAAAYPNHPAFTRRFLDGWERPFKVRGTLDAFRSMLQYGIQGFHLAQLRAVRVPALVLWGAHDTVDQVAAGRRSAHALHAPFDLVAGRAISRCSARPVRSRARSSVSHGAEPRPRAHQNLPDGVRRAGCRVCSPTEESGIDLACGRCGRLDAETAVLDQHHDDDARVDGRRP